MFVECISIFQECYKLNMNGWSRKLRRLLSTVYKTSCNPIVVVDQEDQIVEQMQNIPLDLTE